MDFLFKEGFSFKSFPLKLLLCIKLSIIVKLVFSSIRFSHISISANFYQRQLLNQIAGFSCSNFQIALLTLLIKMHESFQFNSKGRKKSLLRLKKAERKSHLAGTNEEAAFEWLWVEITIMTIIFPPLPLCREYFIMNSETAMCQPDAAIKTFPCSLFLLAPNYFLLFFVLHAFN